VEWESVHCELSVELEVKLLLRAFTVLDYKITNYKLISLYSGRVGSRNKEMWL